MTNCNIQYPGGCLLSGVDRYGQHIVSMQLNLVNEKTGSISGNDVVTMNSPVYEILNVKITAT